MTLRFEVVSGLRFTVTRYQNNTCNMLELYETLKSCPELYID